MGNPKAPRIARSSHESVGGIDYLTQRLQLLGATHEEIMGVRRNWADDDDDWGDEDRAAILQVSDAELKRMLHATREEYPYEPERVVEELEQNPGGVVTGVDDLQTPEARRAQATAEATAASTPPTPEATPDTTPTPEGGDSGHQGGADGESGDTTTPEGESGGDTPTEEAPAFDITGAVPGLLEYVGDDVDKARAVLDAEYQHAGTSGTPARKTLVEPLHKVLADGTS